MFSKELIRMKHKLFKFKKMNKSLQLLIILAVITIAIFLLTITNVYQRSYEIERYTMANETISSPITIEDTRETERRKREVLQAVEDRYLINEDLTSERMNYVDELFEIIDTVNEPLPVEEPVELDEDEPVHTEEDADEESEAKVAEVKVVEKSRADKLQEFKQLASQEIVEHMNDDHLMTIISATNRERQGSYELLISTLNEIFSLGIQKDQLADAEAQLAQRLEYSTLNDELKMAIISVGELVLVENSFFSLEATMEAETQALSNVEPVMIRAGETIVREGQTITSQIYEKLNLVGLLNSDRNIFPVLGLVILIFLIVSLIGYALAKYLDPSISKFNDLIAIATITITTISIMKALSIFATDTNRLYLLMPIAASSILIKILFRERLALVFAIVFSVLGMIIFNQQIPGSLNLVAGIYLLAAQLSSIATLISLKERSSVFKAILATGIVNVLVIFGFAFLSFESNQLSEVFIFSAYGLISALVSGIVAFGALPFFESILNLLSDTKLLTYANPNHPLLRKILTNSPGTYHHSVMVANLSEAACEAIGANGLLARVASYYHDLGKTTSPLNFIENQMGIKNPHDDLAPKRSAEIIIAHPYDGAAILKEHKMPKAIIDIAKEHHGTTVLKFFYYKEKEINPDVKEEDFRYPGPLPQTKESAIVSLCDPIEAAVRSMEKPTKYKIDQLIDQIIKDRVQSGQLDESDLTFKEITQIKKTVSETLNGFYHSRIQYPRVDKEGDEVAN